MIEICDNDSPIKAACKIIYGVKPYQATELMRNIAKAVTGKDDASETIDMFSVKEIKEIADYLMIYCKAHENGD